MTWMLQLLAKEEGLTEQHRERLADLTTANEQLIALMNDLLSIASVEAGVLTTEKHQGDLIAHIHAACALLQSNATAKHIAITVTPPARMKDAYFDPALLTKTFTNILSNAIDYAAPSSTIAVTVRKHEDAYVVDVHDVGLAIPADELPHLFSKFFRGRGARSTKSSGSGLGLYIAKAAAEANGGTIWFESREDSGTTFSFTVPMHAPHASSEERPA